MKKVRAVAVLLALCLTVSAVSMCMSVSAVDAGQPTVTFVAGGEVLAVVPYQAGDTEVQEPALPVIKGNTVYNYIAGANIVLYEYVWPDYELTGESITVVAKYALVKYDVRFYTNEDAMNSGDVYKTCVFTIEDASYDIIPDVPAVEGKYGTWHLVAVSGDSRTIDVVAQYTDKPFAEEHDGHLYRLVNGVYGCDGDHNVLAQGKIHVTEDGLDYYVYVKNGIPQHLGVIKEAGGLRYINSTGRIVYNNPCYYIPESSTNGLLPAGYYEINAAGFIVYDGQIKNGVVHDLDGEVRYYVDGVAQKSVGVVQDENGNLYYIGTNKEVATKNETGYWIRSEKTNGKLEEGAYNIGADGVIDVDSRVASLSLEGDEAAVAGVYMVNRQVVCVSQYRMTEQRVADRTE